MKIAEVDKFMNEFYDCEDGIMIETGKPIKFDLTEGEQIGLFLITEMYQRDKNFTAHIRGALSDYMELKRTQLNL